MFMSLEHEKKDKVQVPQLNEMLNFHLVLLVKMNNIIPKKIYLVIGIWKTWYYKKLFKTENDQLKCGDYSLLYSMREDDNEQYFI